MICDQMERENPKSYHTIIIPDGPPSTTWGGMAPSGQPSILIRDNFLQSANSNGSIWRQGLSFKYNSSNDSRVPEYQWQMVSELDRQTDRQTDQSLLVAVSDYFLQHWNALNCQDACPRQVHHATGNRQLQSHQPQSSWQHSQSIRLNRQLCKRRQIA
jgi:hypothetical protein